MDKNSPTDPHAAPLNPTPVASGPPNSPPAESAPVEPSRGESASGESAPQKLVPLELVPLPGSERSEPTELLRLSPRVSSDERAEATVVLRRRAPVPSSALEAVGDRSSFAAVYGADPSDVAAVTERLAGLGLDILATDPASRRVRVAGPVGVFSRVFGTELGEATPPDPNDATQHRVRSGGLSIPADLDGIVTAVLGLDDRPQSRALWRAVSPQAVTTSYTPVQLGQVYDFPPDTDGSGQTVAIIELGGGFVKADLNTYFKGLGVGSPSVTAVGVDGAANQPGADPSGADGEVMLDIEVVGALAPGADIVVYFAPNTDAGFLDAVATATHADPTPVAISISWGQNEEAWTEQARTAMDDAFVDAAALGVTVTAAAGDDGSSDRVGDGQVHVDFPASSPHALACGGTRLAADPRTGAVSSETVWNNGEGAGATGGGYSTSFARPAYQSSIAGEASADSPAGRDAGEIGDAAGAVGGGGPAARAGDVAPTGRGVPDVSAVADPQTGYQILVDGKSMVIGGTSAVAPLWAALVARLAQAGGKPLGLLQPKLYAAARAGQVAPGFRDVVSGDNGAYSAGPGWDACTGLGVPVGTALGAVLE
ncbi:MAG: peptidase [Pseudonocardiales bacterium]|nr:peptidase [Pseudonocardiales bacterium]